MSQQQQQDEERRRSEEEAIAASDRDFATDCQIRRDIYSQRYDNRMDMTPDGRIIADWNSSIVGPQMQKIVDQRKPEGK